MCDLILGARPLAGAVAPTLSAAALTRALELLGRARRRDVRLHADWSRPPVDLAWLGDTLQRRGLRATISCLVGDDFEALSPLWSSGCVMSVVVSSDAAAPPPQALPRPRGAEIFLALATPGQDVSRFHEWLDRLVPGAPTCKVRIGVGWRDALAGPFPLDERDRAAWSASLEGLLRAVTARRIDTELACGFPLCYFPREVLGRLVGLRVVWPISTCPLALRIDPDGDVHFCPRIRSPRRFNVAELESLEPVTQAIDQRLGPFRGVCARAEAPPCRSLVTRTCGGGCLEHELAAWRTARPAAGGTS
jgi:radical SAM protein with 4Fe4S-binding SPASM domain